MFLRSFARVAGLHKGRGPETNQSSVGDDVTFANDDFFWATNRRFDSIRFDFSGDCALATKLDTYYFGRDDKPVVEVFFGSRCLFFFWVGTVFSVSFLSLSMQIDETCHVLTEGLVEGSRVVRVLMS